MSEDFDDEVARFSAAQERLSSVLSDLATRTGAVGGSPTDLPLLVAALTAMDELREFIIRDLGVAVGQLQEVQESVGTLSRYFKDQRDSLNDMAAGFGALVDQLVGAGTLDGDEFLRKKSELLQGAPELVKTPKLN